VELGLSKPECQAVISSWFSSLSEACGSCFFSQRTFEMILSGPADGRKEDILFKVHIVFISQVNDNKRNGQ
jgi:hypothetical protein